MARKTRRPSALEPRFAGVVLEDASDSVTGGALWPAEAGAVRRGFRADELVDRHARARGVTAAQDGADQIVDVQGADRMAPAAEQRDLPLRRLVDDRAGSGHAGSQQDGRADDGGREARLG